MSPEQLAKSGTESGHQRAVFAWAALNVATYPELRWMHAIPNGGYRDKITAGKLKAEGVKPGVADIFLPVARGDWHGLYIELKKEIGGKTSAEQIEFGDFVKAQGYGFVVSREWQYTVNTLMEYLNYGR